MLVRHLDPRDLGMQALHGGAIAAQRLVIHRHLVGARRDEALGAVVVVAGAHVVVAGGDVAPLRGGGIGGAATRSAIAAHSSRQARSRSASAARALSRRPTRSISSMATAP